MTNNQLEQAQAELREGIETARALVHRYRERMSRQVAEHNPAKPFLLKGD